MADIRIKDLTTPASSTASDDFIAVDGTTNGTRKLSAFSPTFGGNATVTGTLTTNGNVTINSNVGIIGKSGTGTGGNWRFVSDDGTSRWLTGLLGGSGETSYSIYDSANSRSLLTATAAGVVQINQTTASTTTSSGALVVGNGTSGGLGVGGDIHASNVSSFSSSAVRAKLDSSGQVSWGVSANQGILTWDTGKARIGGQGTNDVYLVTNSTAERVKVAYSDGAVSVLSTTASTSTSSGALVVSGGVGVAGNTNIGGVVSVGGSSNAAVGVYVINTALTGTDQYGVASEPIWTSAATSGHTIWARTKTAASAFTLNHGQAFFVEQPTLGAGSSITNIYGMRVRNQGTTGVTNAYGLYVESQSGASSVNYAIYTAGGRINFQGLPTSSAGLPAGTLWNDGGTLKVA